jgi:hypothetical protein
MNGGFLVDGARATQFKIARIRSGSFVPEEFAELKKDQNVISIPRRRSSLVSCLQTLVK